MTEKKKNAEILEKKCFFVTPIGEEGSVEFKQMEAILQNVINPVLEENGYESVVAHEIQKIGSIGDQVFSAIKDADLIISNLTGQNANVMYETAVAHSFGKPTVILSEKGGKKLPFDLSGDRVIFFEDSIEGSGKLRLELDKKIKHIIDNPIVDNPVLRVMKQEATLQSISGKNDIESQMFRILVDLQDRVRLLGDQNDFRNVPSKATYNKQYPATSILQLEISKETGVEGSLKEMITEIRSVFPEIIRVRELSDLDSYKIRIYFDKPTSNFKHMVREDIANFIAENYPSIGLKSARWGRTTKKV